MRRYFLGLRAALYYVFLAVSAVIFTLAIFLAWPLPFQYGRQQLCRSWCWMALQSGALICGMRYRVVGRENCPKTPAVYLIKHQSAWETITLPALLPPCCCVAKEALLNIPFFGWSMRLCAHIPIDRKATVSAFKKVIRMGKERIARGLSIVIFPEGTRVAPRSHPKFHRTAVMLALDAGVPVVPVAHNSGSCWTRNSFFKTPGRITVVIGKPIPSAGKKAEDLNDEVYEWIKNEMSTLEK